METKELTFSLHGPSITDLCRQKFQEGDITWALNMLTGCLQTDELSDIDIWHLAIDILDGRAKLIGTYPHDDYGFEMVDDESQWNQIAKTYTTQHQTMSDAKEDASSLADKLRFIQYNLYESDKEELEDTYMSEFDEPLFENTKQQKDENPMLSSMLDSFIKNQKTGCDNDYGWLKPDGTFYPVDFGEHQQWAETYVKNNMPSTDWFNASSFDNITGMFHNYGDYLISKGWALLDNPALGLAQITNVKPFTKAQKEFLFDYWTKRKQPERANALYKDE